MGYRAPAEGAARLNPLLSVMPLEAHNSWDNWFKLNGRDINARMVRRFFIACSTDNVPSNIGIGNFIKASLDPLSFLAKGHPRAGIEANPKKAAKQLNKQIRIFLRTFLKSITSFDTLSFSLNLARVYGFHSQSIKGKAVYIYRTPLITRQMEAIGALSDEN